MRILVFVNVYNIIPSIWKQKLCLLLHYDDSINTFAYWFVVDDYFDHLLINLWFENLITKAHCFYWYRIDSTVINITVNEQEWRSTTNKFWVAKCVWIEDNLMENNQQINEAGRIIRKLGHNQTITIINSKRRDSAHQTEETQERVFLFLFPESANPLAINSR